MSITVLELDGVDIPLPDDSEIAVNYRANDIRNFGSRDGSYAESFTLPDTNVVRRALGNSQFITSGTKAPYRLLTAKLKQRGNAILTGYAGHTEVNEGFSIDVDGGNADLFAIVKGKKLSEIDLSDLDHTWNIDNVVAANSHSTTRGYVYPLINYGKFTHRELFNGNVHFNELRPAVYVHTLIERMIAPYTLTGSLLANPKYRKLVVPCTNPYLKYRESFIADKYTKAETTEDTALPDDPLQAIHLKTDTIASDALNLLEPIAGASDAYAFIVPIPGNYQLKADVLFSSIFGGTGTSFDVYAWRLRGVDTERLVFESYPSGAGQKMSIDFKIENCLPGDSIYIMVHPPLISNGNAILKGSYFEVQLLDEAKPGGPMHLEANLPDMSQEDLLLAVFNMFNVLEQASPVQTVLRLDSLEQIKYQKPVDWSRKIDWLQQPKTVFALGEYGQRNYLSYAENEATDDAGEPLTDAMVFEIDNQRLSPEEEIFTSEFTFTQTLPAFNGQTDLAYIPVYNQAQITFGLWQPGKQYFTGQHVYHLTDFYEALVNNMGIGPAGVSNATWQKVISTVVFEQQEATPRLLLLETRATPIYIGEHHDTASTYPVYTQGTFSGLESATLQAEYHGITEKMLQDSRILTLKARLNIADINGLDFLRPVMLNIPHKNLQGMFYLNGVNQYMPGKNQSTEVELVRIYGMPLVAASTTGHTEFSEEFNSEEFN